MTATCPKCEKPMLSVNATTVPVNTSTGQLWNAVAYSCPQCSAVLGCQLDLVAGPVESIREAAKSLVEDLRQRGAL